MPGKIVGKVFYDEIFPAIDEDRFRVLYSENAPRPNTPVPLYEPYRHGSVRPWDYIDPDDRNLVIYHSRTFDINTRTAAIIKDADILLARCQNKFSHAKEHQLLLRRLEEQTVIDPGGRRLRIKGEEAPKPTSLQNPANPEATFNTKAGKKHTGYVANTVEAVDHGGSVTVDYQYEQNIYSDSRFPGDHLEQMQPQESSAFIVMDGAYSGQIRRDAAAKKYVKLINTSLKGTPVPDIYADFKISEDGK